MLKMLLQIVNNKHKDLMCYQRIWLILTVLNRQYMKSQIFTKSKSLATITLQFQKICNDKSQTGKFFTIKILVHYI